MRCFEVETDEKAFELQVTLKSDSVDLANDARVVLDTDAIRIQTYGYPEMLYRYSDITDVKVNRGLQGICGICEITSTPKTKLFIVNPIKGGSQRTSEKRISIS